MLPLRVRRSTSSDLQAQAPIVRHHSTTSLLARPSSAPSLTFNRCLLLTASPYAESTCTAPSSTFASTLYSTAPSSTSFVRKARNATSSSAASTMCAVPSIPSSPCCSNAEYFLSDTFSARSLRRACRESVLGGYLFEVTVNVSETKIFCSNLLSFYSFV